MRLAVEQPAFNIITEGRIQYPQMAGWKEETTSRDAATAIESSGRAKVLRDKVLALLTYGHPYSPLLGHIAMTADEAAEILGESILSVRPRISELHKRGLIEPTGERRRSSGGKPSHVWRLK